MSDLPGTIINKGKDDGEISCDSESQNDANAAKASRKRRHRESSSSSNSSASSSSSSSSSSNSTSSSSDDEEEIEIVEAKRVRIMSQESAANYLLQSSSQKPKINERETLPKYLMRQLSINDENDLLRVIKLMPEIVGRTLNGKHVTATYAKVPINFVISGITHQSADRLPAFFRGPTVAKYIQQKQNITLKHPEWPCVIQTGGGKHQSYYPIELLFIS